MQTKGEALGARELPTCEVCHLQPTPESVQHLPFMIIEAMLLFYSLKLAAAMFLASYCFARNGWYCPQCKREVVIDFEIEGSSENLVIRLGNCMIMLARIKFRIISALIIGYLLFSFITDPRSTPKFHVEKSWRSLANNCGYEAFMENSFRANSIYDEYPKLGEWTVEGIFLREEPNLERKITKMYIKMDPSQFRSPVTEDLVVYQTDHTSSDYSSRAVGDVVRFTGQWQGREGEGHEFRFIATKIQKTDKKSDLNRIKLVNAAERFIRIHEEQRAQTKQEKKVENQK